MWSWSDTPYTMAGSSDESAHTETDRLGAHSAISGEADIISNLGPDGATNQQCGSVNRDWPIGEAEWRDWGPMGDAVRELPNMADASPPNGSP